MEKSESSSSVFVDDSWIDMFWIIVNVIFSVENDFVLKGVLPSYEYGQPFIVRNVFVFCYSDVTSFLEDFFVIPMWIQFGQSVSDSIVFSMKNNLKDSKLSILINSCVAYKEKWYFCANED